MCLKKKGPFPRHYLFPFKKFAFLAEDTRTGHIGRKINMTKEPKMDLILSKRKILTVNSYCNKKPHTENQREFFFLPLHLHPKIPHFSFPGWFVNYVLIKQTEEFVQPISHCLMLQSS